MDDKINVVFLDFDGVINSYKQEVIKGKTVMTVNYPKDMKVNNEQAMMLLNKLCLEYNLKIVVSSTWRLYDHKYPVKEILKNSGLDENIQIYGKTPSLFGRFRGLEIEAFLFKNPNVENFIILDDDTDMGKYLDHLIKCNIFEGFGPKEYEMAVNYIENNFEYNMKKR